MFNLSENLHIIFWFLLLLKVVLIIYFVINHQKLKAVETNRLNLLYAEYKAEKNKAIKLKKTPKQIQLLKKNTHQKILKIKIDVVNIRFTLNEIFN